MDLEEIGNLISHEIDVFVEILHKTGTPVYRQGSFLANETYPPLFITYWSNEIDNLALYNNKVNGLVLSFDLFIYSDDIEKLYSESFSALQRLKEAGYESPNFGMDTDSDSDTHYGRFYQVTKKVYFS